VSDGQPTSEPGATPAGAGCLFFPPDAALSGQAHRLAVRPQGRWAAGRRRVMEE